MLACMPVRVCLRGMDGLREQFVKLKILEVYRFVLFYAQLHTTHNYMPPSMSHGQQLTCSRETQQIA